MSVRSTTGDDEDWQDTYSSNGFHAQYERILGQVAGVRERVLFPQLTEDRLEAAQSLEVVGIVAFEEEVNATT